MMPITYFSVSPSGGATSLSDSGAMHARVGSSGS